MRPIDANDESFRVSLATRQLPWYRRYMPSFTIKRLLKCIGLVLYIVVGCIFYHRVEGWRPFETLYFTVVTIATVGYGYDHPTDDSSRLFTIFYAPLGVYVIYYYVGKEITKWFGVGMRYIKSLELDEAGVMLDRQKKLTIVFIFLMVIFILASGGVFVALEPEWSYIEGVYFAVQTTTVRLKRV